MRTDVAVTEVLAKCEALKRAGFWLPEPQMRPRAWIENFEESDKGVAALLLDQFTYYNSRLTDRLLVASYESIGDGMTKGPKAPKRTELLASLSSAVLTPVEGESPNPTDSGNLLCRKARQQLGLPESAIYATAAALGHAQAGGTVIFVDDFIGSGDQFISTWKRDRGGASFESVSKATPFTCIYVALVATEAGMLNIYQAVPTVALCVAHCLQASASVRAFRGGLANRIDQLLKKYAPRLTPEEPYIAGNELYKRLGYREGGLMFGFEHSIPDLTLPIFWSRGQNGWEPLVERH